MTIGIAAYGPGAGRAVLDGVLATEILGRGAIGGFAVFSVLDERGEHHQVACQEGGVAGLPGADTYRGAQCAAVISSGPNRPEPLSQFLVGRAGLGLVTGHRLPNRMGAAGRPVNVSALDRLSRGIAPAAAVRAELEDNPELDFGLIAVTQDGRIGFGNSARVARRGDLIEASRLEEGRGYALLCNSIFFAAGLQPEVVIGDIVWSRLSDAPSRSFLAELAGPVPVSSAPEDRVELDGSGRVTRVYRAEPWLPDEPALTTVIYSQAPVWQDGKPIGLCLSEVFARLEKGCVTPDPACQARFAVERI
ncbi:hypothetical protein [Amorphus sp. 3PC139-8]|uniref:DUF6963 family protein n=1 Tax=Amorphus sp. 3PC139-8 TaxID=2735676 RepID=UPI00345D6CF7